jgi:pantothenate kinase
MEKEIIDAASGIKRMLVSICGIPGSGKSTYASALSNSLQERGHDVALVPMDGFHYSKVQLSAFTDPDEAFKRRGAPYTIDAEGFFRTVKAIRSNESEVFAPAFAHSVGDPVPDAIQIRQSDSIVIFEGLYLHLNEPWIHAFELMDLNIFIDIPIEVAMDRVAKRHVECGMRIWNV